MLVSKKGTPGNALFPYGFPFKPSPKEVPTKKTSHPSHSPKTWMRATCLSCGRTPFSRPVVSRPLELALFSFPMFGLVRCGDKSQRFNTQSTKLIKGLTWVCGCRLLGDPQNGGFSFGFPLNPTKTPKRSINIWISTHNLVRFFWQTWASALLQSDNTGFLGAPKRCRGHQKGFHRQALASGLSPIYYIRYSKQ